MNGFLLAYGLPLGAAVLGAVVFATTFIESRLYDRRLRRREEQTALGDRFDPRTRHP
jgi:hypothetical protein